MIASLICLSISSSLSLSWSVASGQLSVEQSPEWRGVSEGQNGTVTCTYSSAIQSLHWYRQAPGERPLFLLMLFGKGSETQEPNFTADHDPGSISLRIRGLELRDSATYFCAFNRGTR
uniref:Ig-like domain-containing protein n=1 Tax=Chrysemys picta bellii TaxID=8478 RepID=A0A8C3F637_CHRPI